MIVVLPSCRREVEGLPDDVRGDLADALARLDAGLSLALVDRGSIHVLHASNKTTRATPQRGIAVAQRRLQEVIA